MAGRPSRRSPSTPSDFGGGHEQFGPSSMSRQPSSSASLAVGLGILIGRRTWPGHRRRMGGFVTTALLVALGAAAGAAGRHLTNHWLRERFWRHPGRRHALAVNLLGSLRARRARGRGGRRGLAGPARHRLLRCLHDLLDPCPSSCGRPSRTAGAREVVANAALPASRSVSPRHTWGSGSPPERWRSAVSVAVASEKPRTSGWNRWSRKLSAAHGVQRVDDAVTVKLLNCGVPAAGRGVCR